MLKKKNLNNSFTQKSLLYAGFFDIIIYMKFVQFEDQDYIPRRKSKKKKHIRNNEPELVSWVIEKGWLRNRYIINFIFISISAIFIFISIIFFTGGKAFGFSNRYESRNNQVYYINIPGVEDTVVVRPGEDLSEVIERYK